MGNAEPLNKPWAVLKVSQRDYETAKPWKKTPLSRKEFDELVLSLPDGFLDQLLLEADAERLVEAMFPVAENKGPQDLK